ncbi:hypothetical protein [Murimonas intestini]|uniref:Uncharacterized protein n=2 Tax=Murimonas intestini TaxID=1337051 RepID=A0AB73SZL7_9FIRM|nr:hypothetical protein [Murimonas intestini]MCR1842792.1 hypothetical protein [Murimonas intestini]MCR1867869.1 hypothetical protein [Murimonas intestini]MCR1885220.1 hypothetical protein [Murimonas intestini]
METKNREKFYFKMTKECIDEKTGTIMSHNLKIARKTNRLILLAIAVLGLLEIINSFFVNANIVNTIIAIKDSDIT